MEFPVELRKREAVPSGGEGEGPGVVFQPGGKPVPQGEQVVLLQDVGDRVQHRQLTILRLAEWVLAG